MEVKEIKINFEEIAEILYDYQNRAWEDKEFFSAENVIQAIGDATIIDWGNLLEILDLSATIEGLNKIEELGYGNLRSTTEDTRTVEAAIPYIKAISNGEEPEYLAPYELAGTILVIANFITDYYVNSGK